MKDNLTTNASNEAENPAFLVGAVSSSCLPAFNKIVEINNNNGWVNPIFQPNNTDEFKDKFFCVKVDDFLEIESNFEIKVYRISKRWGEIILYCRVVQYN